MMKFITYGAVTDRHALLIGMTPDDAVERKPTDCAIEKKKARRTTVATQHEGDKRATKHINVDNSSTFQFQTNNRQNKRLK